MEYDLTPLILFQGNKTMIIRFLSVCSVLFCLPAIASSNVDLRAIKTCVAVGGARGQASPPKSIAVVGASKGYFLLRISDRAGNVPYERIIKLNPCKTVYIDQAGQTPSKYGIPSLPMTIVDDLSLQSVQYDIRAQGKAKYFERVSRGVRNGRLELVPEVYKALKKEGFTPKAKVILYAPR
jgi:hypothetical protein